MPAGYICQYAQLPGYSWGSATDQTDSLPGLKCTKLEEPLPFGNLSSWHDWFKIAKLIEGVP